MKSFFYYSYLFGLMINLILFSKMEPCFCSENDPHTKQNEEIDVKKISKAFGHFIGRNLTLPGFTFDIDQVIAGIQMGFNGEEAPMSDDEYEKTLNKIQEQAEQVLSKLNLNQAEEFLKSNEEKEGIIVLVPEKLQYEVLKEGDGETVQEGSTPIIHFTGKFIDGSTFSSTKFNGDTLPISLNQTIPGLAKGITGMKEGEIRRIYIHPDMGYGKEGNLPPNSLLIFDVEVIKSNSSE